MKIGNLNIGGYAALAPMAGVADRAMREICVSMGAGITTGELTSAKAVTLCDKKSFALLDVAAQNGINGSQLFGSDPEIMAKAAEKALSFNPDFIDINMGCPAPKIAGNGGGSALLKEPETVEKIVKAVRNAVDIPLTVKIRIGWDSDSINAVEIARICEGCGADAITVHGRTRVQMYAPPVDYDVIKSVKNAVSVPVIANGDIASFIDAKSVYQKTGCDYVCVGRAARGNPFVFAEINAGFEGREYTPPTLEQRLNTLIDQVKLMQKYKDEHIVFLEARKHTAWYLSGVRGAAKLRSMCGDINCMADIENICAEALKINSEL